MRTADGRVQLQSRQQRPLTDAFPDIVELLAERLPPGAAVDGELVVMTGPRIDFQALQRRLASRRVELPATLVTFTSLATTARISGRWLTSAEAIVGGVLGSLRAPHALVLGRHDQRGRLRVTGRTFPLRPKASAAIAAALTQPTGPHPWPTALPGGRFGLPGWNRSNTPRVAPTLVVETEAAQRSKPAGTGTE
jgi:hypothetical protein